MKRISKEVRDRLRKMIWSLADDLGWSELTDSDRSGYYERWTRDANIGGVLAHYMDPRKVRVYIKDSLLKPYERTRISGTEERILTTLAVPMDAEVTTRYTKPHGMRFTDGRIVSWGNSRDWKSIIMAMFEREFTNPRSSAFAIVLIENGKTADDGVRAMVREAATRLRIERVEWIDW